MEEKIVAVVPIKMKNERLPGKNTKLLGNKPLIQYVLHSLVQSKEVNSINVYCSNEEICKYLIDGVEFIKRPEKLDLNTSNFTQIFEQFMKIKNADIYVYAHATAPYVTVETIRECVEAVKSGKYDSAFCATRIQDYLWQDGTPINFNPENLPRSQDIKPIYRETSGVYVYRKEVFEKYHRRVGRKPYVKEVSFIEAVDINTAEDFELAECLNNYALTNKERG